ncbi:hypothetical protein AMJ44_10585 [candidate division WOR-1 bacterium DG_54_3]|uniref:POTRA domain-containing protein n=1 Tax=candidate division WOR-1 bacterium DG_54_3 TaxID=1703775 RepID=A0A0S7XS28_UNCSA|nr:MAG: hypothetical protein AMJ44_10585 [candidate division WOR-1 bacterium DG_54_3]
MLLKARWIALPLCSFLICTALSTCEKRKSGQSSIPNQTAKKWNRERAELEYRLIQTELKLAKSEELYMVLNFQRKVLRLKLKGAVVWDYPIDIYEADSQEVREFVERFQGDDRRLIRFLSGKHLFAAQHKTPDSILAIVGEAVRANPELLQRDVPARFQLLWGYGLTLEVRTDIVGQPKSPLKSTLVEFRHALRRPFGEAHLIVKMRPADALTLYRAARPGLPTLLYPPL